VIQTFRNAGYVLDHIEGSQHYFTHPSDPTAHFSVPHHSGEMKRSTLAKILKRAGLTVETFLRHDP
jgi:predicted RNA binding protein YcfA (HicA-like mRNA interferase family)